ncbi:MAG: class II aldolase/adducin family protein [Candidatus Glassbacteria bacterium]|nr:class II aldolase/adducin family protein [Candidatus Glassbacteria bacterium]
MPSLHRVKQDIIHVCQRLYQRDLVSTNEGNVSVRTGEDRLVLTPTGKSKGFLTVADLVETDMSGKPLKKGQKASSEIKIHIRAYEKRPDVRAAVHAHPVTATGYAVAGVPFNECILPEIVLTLGKVPIVPYGTPSTEELPDALEPYLPNHDAFLLANHGALTLGSDVVSAYHKMESLEHAAKIVLVARLMGEPKLLSHKEVQRLLDIRERYNLTGVNPGCNIYGKQDLASTVYQGQVSPAGSAAASRTDEESLRSLVERITREVLGKLGT